jgi:hypothetical protein
MGKEGDFVTEFIIMVNIFSVEVSKKNQEHHSPSFLGQK